MLFWRLKYDAVLVLDNQKIDNHKNNNETKQNSSLMGLKGKGEEREKKLVLQDKFIRSLTGTTL